MLQINFEIDLIVTQESFDQLCWNVKWDAEGIITQFFSGITNEIIM